MLRVPVWFFQPSEFPYIYTYKKAMPFWHQDFPLKIIFDAVTGSLNFYPGPLDNDYL